MEREKLKIIGIIIVKQTTYFQTTEQKTSLRRKPRAYL